MATIQTSPTPYGKDIKVKIGKKEPNKKDYYLSGLDIEPADNGFIVNCRYTIQPKVKIAMRKKEEYCDTYREPEKHVFEDKADAVKFITAEVAKLQEGEEMEDNS